MKFIPKLLVVVLLLSPSGTHANSTKNCAINAIEQSVCVYEAIMVDISESYPMVAGGGITSLSQRSTTTYEATISREGVRDVWTYEVAISDNGAVEIIDRTESTK